MITIAKAFNSKKTEAMTGAWLWRDDYPSGGRYSGHTYHGYIYNAKQNHSPRTNIGLDFMKQIQSTDEVASEFTWRELVLKHAAENPLNSSELSQIPPSEIKPYGEYHKAFVNDTVFLPAQIKYIYGVDMAEDSPDYVYCHYVDGKGRKEKVGPSENTRIDYRTYSEESQIAIYRLVEDRGLIIYNEGQYTYNDVVFKDKRENVWFMSSEQINFSAEEMNDFLNQIITVFATYDEETAFNTVERYLYNEIGASDDASFIFGVDLEYIRNKNKGEEK